MENRIFLIQVLICLIAVVSVWLLLNLPKRHSETSWKEQLQHIDILGALLLVLTITSLLYGLNRGSNVSWNSPLTLGSLCATLPLLIAFLAVETRFAVEPLAPAHVIFDKALVACYCQNFFGFAAFNALIIYLPLYFLVVLGMTPIRAGVSLVPTVVSLVFGTLLSGLVVKRTGKLYWLAVTSSTAATIGLIPIVVAPSLNDGLLPSIYIGSIISFVPQGVTLNASLVAISTS